MTSAMADVPFITHYVIISLNLKKYKVLWPLLVVRPPPEREGAARGGARLHCDILTIGAPERSKPMRQKRSRTGHGQNAEEETKTKAYAKMITNTKKTQAPQPNLRKESRKAEKGKS